MACLARLPRQWIKEQGVICIYITFSGSFGLAVDNKGANEPNEPAHFVDD